MLKRPVHLKDWLLNKWPSIGPEAYRDPIYYVEMTPVSAQQPVFALAPSGGDVDVLIASEMMEVGRAIMRGFVTPDRTTLIGSTHRALAYSEKAVPGDGMANSAEVQAGAEVAAQRLILVDMDKLATDQGSVISS